MELKKEDEHVIRCLLIGWLLIFLSYVIIRIIFVIFGFTSDSALGILLAIVPYLLTSLYFFKTKKHKSTWYYALGILFPAIIEKVVLYFCGSFLYGIDFKKISKVCSAMASGEPFMNFIEKQGVEHVFVLSFWSWAYIGGSILFSIFLVGVLSMTNKRDIKTAKNNI